MPLLRKFLISLVTLIVTLSLIGLYVNHVVRLPPRADVTEELNAARPVKAWTTAGLVLDDGAVVSLPGLGTLPQTSVFLDEIIRRGVEINPDTGRVFGLLPIHHWCGNDPVAKHLARIDVARLLEFVGDAATVEGNRREVLRFCRSELGWSDLGWRVECYEQFQEWLATL